MKLIGIEEILKHDEGLSLNKYKDTEGFETCGYGHKITDNDKELSFPITKSQAQLLLIKDIGIATKGATKALSWYLDLSFPRRAVVMSMIFNLGLSGFLKFEKFIKLAKDKEYYPAAQEMMHSAWARQVKDRAARLSKMFATDEWPEVN